MHTELTLEQAISRVYGKTFKRVRDISSSWYLFTPYQNSKTHETFYFKLLEVPSEYRMSEGIYSKFGGLYKGLLH